MNNGCGETIEIVEQRGSFLLIRTGSRFAVVEQRAGRNLPDEARRAPGRVADTGRAGGCDGGTGLAARG